MYKTILFIVILATAQAQLTSSGQCNFQNIPIQIPQLTSYPDTMFELSRVQNTWQTGQCASWTFKQANESITVIMTEVVNRQLIQRNGSLTISGSNHVSITFQDFSSNFTFLGLGQEFAILYACSNNGENKEEYIWRLGNNTIISDAATNATLEILKNNKFENVTWLDISHTKDACHSGATNLKTSAFIILLVGIIFSTEL